MHKSMRDPAAIEKLLRLSFRSQLHDRGRADELRFHYGERSRRPSKRYS